MIQLTSSYVAVVVPKDSKDYFVHICPTRLIFWVDSQHGYDSISLGEGKYEFLCLSTNATEDQAAQVVKLWNENFPYYVNYNYDRTRLHYFEQATSSLASLLESKDITGIIVAILKIV